MEIQRFKILNQKRKYRQLCMSLADISERPFSWRPASKQVAGQQLAGVIKHSRKLIPASKQVAGPSRLRDSIMDIRTSKYKLFLC